MKDLIKSKDLIICQINFSNDLIDKKSSSEPEFRLIRKIRIFIDQIYFLPCQLDENKGGIEEN